MKKGELSIASIEATQAKLREQQVMLVFHSEYDYRSVLEKAVERMTPDQAVHAPQLGVDYIIFPGLAKNPGEIFKVKGTMVDVVRDAYLKSKEVTKDAK